MDSPSGARPMLCALPRPTPRQPPSRRAARALPLQGCGNPGGVGPSGGDAARASPPSGDGDAEAGSSGFDQNADGSSRNSEDGMTLTTETEY